MSGTHAIGEGEDAVSDTSADESESVIDAAAPTIDTSADESESATDAVGDTIGAAPIADRSDGAQCDRDGCDGVYVLYEHDRVCRRCGLLSDSDTNSDTSYRERWLPDQWVTFENGREDYTGWYGEDRVRMVGGFKGSYP